MVQYTAIASQLLRTHCFVSRVVDGDGLFVTDIFSKKETEIRLLGIDAPEIKICRKLLQDEKETRIPGHFLMELGHKSKKFLADTAPIGTAVSLILESKNQYDRFGRALAYVILPDGSCINETLITEGYAKPYNGHFCEALSEYQVLNFKAIREKKGLYSFSELF